MVWKNKIDQLAALLEKIPQPQSFESAEGVYQPYFILELRPANWEILPYAEYTRLDGKPGKEIKLSFQAIETQKVNINQNELNVLSYIYSSMNYDTRRLLKYGQPVGFIFDWLRGSQLKLRTAQDKVAHDIYFNEETVNLSLGIFKHDEKHVVQPALIFSDHSILLEDEVNVLSSNPIYLHYKRTLYRVESNMSALFWINLFRLQQQIEIPTDDLTEFINSFVPKILPAFDWKTLEEHLKLYELPLSETRVYLSERAGHFSVDVKFKYKNMEFQAQPASEKSLATKGNYLFVIKRDIEKERQICRTLQKHGLYFTQHHWQIDRDYKILDWLRTQLPQLAKQGIKFYGEDNLKRYHLRRGVPKLYLKIASKIDWLDIDLRFHINGEPINVGAIKQQVENKKNYVKLADGSNVYIPDDLLQRLQKLFSLFDETLASGKIQLSPTAMPLIDELIAISDEAKTDREFEVWQNKYQSFQKIEQVEVSPAFKGKLRDYQGAGLNWLYFLHRFQFGGILADDMGLGKTVQVISLLQNLKFQGKLTTPSLVVVPLTVLFNWENEFQRFAPNLKILRYQGQKDERNHLAKHFDSYEVVLLSYGILLQDFEILQSHNWKYLILDESQKIKNPTTKTYQAAVSLKVPHRLCLTGTPVENSVTDLWAQFNFLNPGMLGTLKQFEARFIKNGNEESDWRELLRRLIYPFILRRKKEDVLKELPERTEIVQLVEMSDQQKQVYQKWLNHYRDQIFDNIETEGLPKTRLKILEALTYLRQIACHPAIVDNMVGEDESGKIQLLEEMLEELLQEGHKVLVYSQFVRFLGLVKKLLLRRGWQFEYLDGSTRNREDRIRNFQGNPDLKIFLISLKAGGLGLNLTAADYVIHLDPWWNPAVERQATDRVHRIGQENRVFVYKYIVKNTVEEKLLNLQEHKKELSDTLITSEKGFVKQLSKEDLHIIFQPSAE